MNLPLWHDSPKVTGKGGESTVMRGFRVIPLAFIRLWIGALPVLAQTEETSVAAEPSLVQVLLVLGILVIALGGLIIAERVRRPGKLPLGGRPRRTAETGRGREGTRGPEEHEMAYESGAKEGFMPDTERNFIRATVAGFLATFTFTMAGFWGVGIGLPKIDVGALMAASMGHAYGWGQTAHFLNGIVLALIYAFWLYHWLPGPRLVKGFVYGILTTIAAGLIVVPLASTAAQEPSGIFFANAPNTGLMILAALIVHLVYGLTLGALYKPVPET